MRAFVLLTLAFTGISMAERMKLYDYFTGGDENLITKGLEANDPNHFELNGKPMKILGGSMHYFRIHPDHWRDRLRKYRASGLNTIDVYVPWNLHQPRQGEYDFGEGDNDFSMFLNLRKFLMMCKEEDLLVILRPGPYICAEWEFGGLPRYVTMV